MSIGRLCRKVLSCQGLPAAAGSDEGQLLFIPGVPCTGPVPILRNGRSDSLTTDRSQLASLGSVLQEPTAHTVLPETISEELLGPIVPNGDDQWFDIVKTVMAILTSSETYGITSDSIPASPTRIMSVDRYLSYRGSFRQEDLSLSRTVAQDVLRAVGNHCEIYRRSLDSLDTRNALWTADPCRDCPKGGQIYAAPLR